MHFLPGARQSCSLSSLDIGPIPIAGHRTAACMPDGHTPADDKAKLPAATSTSLVFVHAAVGGRVAKSTGRQGASHQQQSPASTMGASVSQYAERWLPAPSNSLPTAPPPQTLPASSPLSQPKGFMSYFIPSSEPTHKHRHPTIHDVQLIYAYIASRLPGELVGQVMDEAEIWPVCWRAQRAKMVCPSRVKGGINMMDGGLWETGQEAEVGEAALERGLRCRNGEAWYLVSSPIGCFGEQKEGQESETEEHERRRKAWVKKVVIETSSRDQGWSDHRQHYGTYKGSHSWFEISLLRNDLEVPGSRAEIQFNVHAGQFFKEHTNVLLRDHPTLRLAKDGDRVVLWAKALYPGWVNAVKYALRL
ncbi:hypothetical protein, variant [Cryptococcus amylolentus CBS 6039]|uniref:Uncharacterized protein n=1 Tax=Cryptococcus amylolentus CBS 6039 TaxID=1295533 RepID=A0A1E3HSQ5_9TREE|nr:hypothetical protein, variant [Cryptococcus amylolentus CBS 6039]ODN79389.1 hypothetical protein, variant [Cryptococcus amylolentus CBS 6039]